MSWRLIAKESFKFFKSKIFLFLTFIPFLILVISLIVGLFSFAANFQTTFDETLGYNRVNFKIYTNRTFEPSWIGDEENDSYYFVKEKKDPKTNTGYFYNFMLDLWNEDNPELTTQSAQLLILGVGYNWGQAKLLTNQDLLSNKLLGIKFGDSPQNLKDYNDNVNTLAWLIFNRFQTNNLVTAFFLDFLQKNDGLLAHSSSDYWNSYFVEPQIKQQIQWQYLNVNESLIPSDPTFYKETPWTLRTNTANRLQVQKQVDWNQYPEFLKERNFLYFSPKFLHDSNLKIGQTVDINFDLTLPDQPIDDSLISTGSQFLVAGTIVNSNNFDHTRWTYFVPFQWITKYYQSHNLMPPSTRLVIYAYLPKFGNDWQSGQKFASNLFNSVFTNLEDPQIPLETETEWTEWLPSYGFKSSALLFVVLSYSVSILMIILLVTVFYFITKQLIAYQANSLIFLKSLGVPDIRLSILVTVSSVIPLIISLVFGFFGALIIQQMISRSSFATATLYWDYFMFGPIFFLSLALLAIVLIFIFYIVNFILINNQRLDNHQGNRTGKVIPQWSTKVKLKLPNYFSSKFRIGLSFVFKNLTQNFITYVLLTITFSIILYTVEFKASISHLSQSYEKWNQPYKSINYNSQIYLYSPVEKREMLQSYETITTLDSLVPIDNFEIWNDRLKEYIESILDGENQFNWKEIYLTKNFSLEIIDLVKDKSRFEKAIEILKELLSLLNNPEQEKEILSVILNLANQIELKFDLIRQKFKYNDGFNFLFGRVLLNQNRNVWAIESFNEDLSNPIPFVTFNQNNLTDLEHFGFAGYSTENDYLLKETNPSNSLKVNISNYFAMKNNYKKGDTISLTLNGLKKSLAEKQIIIKAHINQIIDNNNVTNEIYTSQEGLINYLINESQIDETVKNEYQILLNNLKQNQISISNSVFDAESELPFGLKNLTLPLFHHYGLENNAPPGSRIEDFYDQAYSNRYFDDLGKQVMVFNEASKKATGITQQFVAVLNNLIAIFIIISLIISLILTNLFLLENQRVIALLKSIGYRINEIQWYLIFGYFIATILALGSAIGFSVLIFNLSSQILNNNLGFNLYFIWGWSYFLTLFALGFIFVAIIETAVVIFIKKQNPRILFDE